MSRKEKENDEKIRSGQQFLKEKMAAEYNPWLQNF